MTPFRSEMTMSATLQNSKISHHSEIRNETLISKPDVRSKTYVWFGWSLWFVFSRFVHGWKTKIKYETEPDGPLGVTTLYEIATLYDWLYCFDRHQSYQVNIPLSPSPDSASWPQIFPDQGKYQTPALSGPVGRPKSGRATDFPIQQIEGRWFEIVLLANCGLQGGDYAIHFNSEYALSLEFDDVDYSCLKMQLFHGNWPQIINIRLIHGDWDGGLTARCSTQTRASPE
jgi:hypothetical protein